MMWNDDVVKPETKKEIVSLAGFKKFVLDKDKGTIIVQILTQDGRVFSNFAHIWDSCHIDIEPLKSGDKLGVEYIVKEKDGRTYNNFIRVWIENDCPDCPDLPIVDDDDGDLPF